MLQDSSRQYQFWTWKIQISLDQRSMWNDVLHYTLNEHPAHIRLPPRGVSTCDTHFQSMKRSSSLNRAQIRIIRSLPGHSQKMTRFR